MRKPAPRSTKKTHNRANAIDAKRILRRNVLERVDPARVFDVYCGPDGEMWSAVWHEAADYIGCDLEWKPTDPRRRFVGDALRVLRAVDLSGYNVFDIDAFGSPWEAALILLARRKWAKGERGAVVFTDGGNWRIRLGSSAPRAMTELIDIKYATGCGTEGVEALHRMAVSAFLDRAGVTVLGRWTASSSTSGVGGFPMFYTSVVFEGGQ